MVGAPHEEEARAAAEVAGRRCGAAEPARRAVHPDHAAAAPSSRTARPGSRRRGEVAPRGEGYKVTMTVASHEDAVALAERVAGSTVG